MSDEIAPAAPEAAPTPVKERHSLTLDQRRALRRWASSQPVRPSHKACIDWFHTEYGQTISQSTVSHSLSPKYARLDADAKLSGSRLRFGNWPDVEKLVLLWHQQVVNSGRHPSNEELAEKAKSIFAQLPRYKDETPPEFSPGWVHRFKKRYGLLIRRQRRHSDIPNPADDVPYLVDAVPRFMEVTADASPAVIRAMVQRVVGVEPSLAVCARVRDEILRRGDNPPQQQQQQQHTPQPLQHPQLHPQLHPQFPPGAGAGDTTTSPMYTDEDPDVVLQNALRALQQEEADAEAQAAVAREERSSSSLGAIASQACAAQQAANGNGNGNANNNALSSSTPVRATGSGGAAEDLTLTPIPSDGPVSATDRPVRCPFCVNQRMLRTIKEAVEHLSTHVVV